MKRSIKRNNESGSSIAISEFKKMLPVFLIGFLILLITCVIYCIVTHIFDYRLFSGIAIGCMASAAYFISLGYSSEEVLIKKNQKKARFSANAWYGVRYVGLFALYIFLLYFNFINIITAAIPLFFPRIHYLIEYFRIQKFE